MLDAVGDDYGLPVTFVPWRAMPEPAMEAPVQLRPRIRQPWEPRPMRRAA